jgi:tetratricopeptide (TPR) repeat protein
MVPAQPENVQMYAATRSPAGRLAAATFVAVPFALLACTGGEKTSSTVALAEAHPVESTTPAPVMTPDSNTVVTVEPKFTFPIDAYNAGRYDDAVTMYTAHVGEKPNDAHGWYMLGLSSWKAGDLSRAKDAFDTSIGLDSSFAKSYFNQARVLLDLKRAPEALEMVEKGRTIDSTSPDGLRLKARAQSEGGDVDGALATYRELLVRDDADVWGLNNLGVLLLDRGQFEDALGPLARVVQVRPTSPVFQNNLGMALERSGHKVAALKHYEIGVAHDSTFMKVVKNAERLRMVVDSTAAVEVNVMELAEQFRQKVKGWKEGVTQ